MGAQFASENYVGYWLFYTQRCVAYAFAEVLREHCRNLHKPYEVTPPQWGLLSLLHDHNGMTVGSISQRRGVDAPTVTGIVKRLEQCGLVERQHDRQDRRMVKVYLTEEGREITISLFDVVQTFSVKTLHGFSLEEQAKFTQQLQQIVTNLASVAEGVGDRFGLLPESATLAYLPNVFEQQETENAHE